MFWELFGWLVWFGSFLVENEGGDEFHTWFSAVYHQGGMHRPWAIHRLDSVVTGFPGVTIKSQLLPSCRKTHIYRNFVKVIEQKLRF